MHSHIHTLTFSLAGCVCAKPLQSCPTLCDPVDCNPPGSSVHRILQARILEWDAMPPPGDLPDPGIEPESLTSPTLAGGFCTTSTTWEALIGYAAVLCCSVMSSSLPPHSYSPSGYSVHGDSPGKNAGAGCHPPGDLPNPAIEPTLQVDSLPSEPPGKPKNTGVGSLSLRQGNFLTQELNQSLLRCRGFFTS